MGSGYAAYEAVYVLCRSFKRIKMQHIPTEFRGWRSEMLQIISQQIRGSRQKGLRCYLGTHTIGGDQQQGTRNHIHRVFPLQQPMVDDNSYYTEQALLFFINNQHCSSRHFKRNQQDWACTSDTDDTDSSDQESQAGMYGMTFRRPWNVTFEF